MATSEDSSAQGVRLLNTVRFNLKKKDGALPVLGRTDFAKKIVLGKLGCSTADNYCLQDVTSRGIFDEHVFKNCPSRVRSYAEAARSASEVPKAACPVPAARTSIAREVSDAVGAAPVAGLSAGPAAAPPAAPVAGPVAVPVASAASVAPVVSVSVAGSAGVVAEAGPVVSGKDADLSQASRVLAAAVAGAPPGVAGDCSSWGEIMDTQESKVMYSSVLRDPRVKSRREDIVSEDEQPAKISRSESRVSVSADVVGNVDISDFTESSESGGVPGCSQVFESFGTSDSSVGSGGGASPGLEIDAFSPASVDSEDMCFGNVEVFCSITGMPKDGPDLPDS
ncbi:UNVERIFIED_CONTAM: hypothetical protein FKN15_041073 [Acipenser sinensis]